MISFRLKFHLQFRAPFTISAGDSFRFCPGDHPPPYVDIYPSQDQFSNKIIKEVIETNKTDFSV